MNQPSPNERSVPSTNVPANAQTSQEQTQNAVTSLSGENQANKKAFQETTTNEVQPTETDEGLTQ